MNDILNNGNAKIEQFGKDVEIEIPSKKNIIVMFFLIVWVSAWLIGEVTALQNMIFSGGYAVLFLWVWIAGWTVGGGFGLFMLLWMFFGSEVFSSYNGMVTIEKRVLFFGKKRFYEMPYIKEIRAVDKGNLSMYSTRKSMEFYGLSGGAIQFDYGMKTISFGVNIDFAEANYIVNHVLTPMFRKEE